MYIVGLPTGVVGVNEAVIALFGTYDYDLRLRANK